MKLLLITLMVPICVSCQHHKKPIFKMDCEELLTEIGRKINAGECAGSPITVVCGHDSTEFIINPHSTYVMNKFKQIR